MLLLAVAEKPPTKSFTTAEKLIYANITIFDALAKFEVSLLYWNRYYIAD
jgi:hypothetical protein